MKTFDYRLGFWAMVLALGLFIVFLFAAAVYERNSDDEITTETTHYKIIERQPILVAPPHIDFGTEGDGEI